RRLPLVTGIPVLALAGYALAKEIRKFLNARKESQQIAPSETEASSEQSQTTNGLKPIAAIGVILAFTFLYIGFGFPYGSTAFIFLLLWFIGKMKIWKAAAITAAIV